MAIYPAVAVRALVGAAFLGRTGESGDGFRESHIAFTAADRAEVQAFFDAAVAAGAVVLHEPRVWPSYHPDYYGAFVRTRMEQRGGCLPRTEQT